MLSDRDVASRRKFLKLTAGAGAAVVMFGAWPGRASSADLPHVAASDPTAKALGYVDDASKTHDAKHKAGDNCASCQFYSGAASGFGPCQLFPGKAVSAKGWCISHTPKAG